MSEAAHSAVLPVGGAGTVSTAWWGMVCLIATEAILFVYLIFSYAYLGSQQNGPWPPSGPPSLTLAGSNTVILIGSSLVLGWGLRMFKRSHNSRNLTLVLLATIVLASREHARSTPALVASYIVAAYWFTASTSFANPAVTLARGLTATFAGIRPADVAGFVLAQCAGAALVTLAMALSGHRRAASH